MSWAEAIRIKRYIGNTGRVVHVKDTPVSHRPQQNRGQGAGFQSPEPPKDKINDPVKNPSDSSPSGSIDSEGILSSLKALFPSGTDLGDILVLAVFLFLYIESKDTDFLIILAVLAFSFFKDTQLLSGLSGLSSLLK